MKTVPEMIEKAMPGLLYPVKKEEVEVGDYFSNDGHRYAHILQNRVKRINAAIHIPLRDATLASYGIAYWNFH